MCFGYAADLMILLPLPIVKLYFRPLSRCSNTGISQYKRDAMPNPSFSLDHVFPINLKWLHRRNQSKSGEGGNTECDFW
jgi:hypothetical protein